MIDRTKIYPSGTVFQMLLKGPEAGKVVGEWFSMNRTCDLRVRRAKTRGCVVIECSDLLFTSHVVQWWPNVNVKEPV